MDKQELAAWNPFCYHQLINDSPPLTIIHAHDYQCPWCWVGMLQSKRLKEEFPQITMDWQGYELIPGLKGVSEIKRPDMPERLQALADADGAFPGPWPAVVSTRAALEGAEFFKDKHPDLFDAYNEAVYCSFYQDQADISDLDLLISIAVEAGAEGSAFREAVETRTYKDTIIEFQEEAYARGIRYIPTFSIPGEQCAEAPYETIREMVERLIARKK